MFKIATNQDLIVAEVRAERVRQTDLYGKQNHSRERWAVILGEEFGEVCRAIYDKDTANYRDELIQVAAVAVAMLECLDREQPEEK